MATTGAIQPQRLAVVEIADLPPPGSEANAIEQVKAYPDSPYPASILKRRGYNCLEFVPEPGTVANPAEDAGDYALYRYWDDVKSWLPEGPRGATPTTVDYGAAPAGIVPIRVSTELNEGLYAVILCSGNGVQVQGEIADVLIKEQQR